MARLDLLLVSLGLLAGGAVPTIAFSAAQPEFHAPIGAGECDPDDVGGGSSGTICGTTVIYCAGVPQPHYPGECGNEDGEFCRHTNIKGRADGCPGALHGHLFVGEGGSVVVTGITGPFIVPMNDVSPDCGEEATKTVRFMDSSDPSHQLGEKSVSFKCDSCGT